MNHSCLPNIEAKLEGGGLVVRTLHEITAGSEINNIYVPLTVEDDERKRMIQGTWKFTCQCVRCVTVVRLLVYMPRMHQHTHA